MPEGYRPLEYVLVLAIIGDGGIGTGYIEIVAQLREKQLVVGAFGSGGTLPSLDKWMRWHDKRLSCSIQCKFNW